MDAPLQQHGDDDPVASDIESRNPDSGDIVAGEQVLDSGHIAPDQNAGPIAGSPEGTRDTSEDRLHGADDRSDPAAPPRVEQPD